MKRYEIYLKQCIRHEWSVHYIDYALLKEKQRQFYKRRRQLRKLISPNNFLAAEDFCLLIGTDYEGSVDGSSFFQYFDGCTNSTLVDKEDAVLRLSIIERKEFSLLLEQEVSKAAVFYTGTLLANLQNLVNENKDVETMSMELLETIAFCATNIVTFRQLMIRYDAFRRTFDGMPLSEWHVQRSILGLSHPVHALFGLDGLKEMEDTISEKMHESNISTESFKQQIECFANILQKTSSSLEKAVAGHLVFKDKITEVIQKYLFFGFQSRALLYEPESLGMRGRHLKSEIRAIGKWRDVKDFPLKYRGEIKGEESFSQKLKTMKPENVFPLFLNLLSCFFFMMNNYIIEPSSAYYASALGSSDALSGIMIGAAPWFAMISSIGYSYWTNYNYRQPIIFAGFLQFVGNLMYANAYAYQSMEMCLIGRAITGLGAPRIINRRYVADATPFSLRTAASAAFAMTTALGAALGPGMAILLANLDFEFYIPFLKKQVFNGMTGPGYFMALNWVIYTLAIALFFNEPTRSGLDELREREESDGIELAGAKRGESCDDNHVDAKHKSLLDTNSAPAFDEAKLGIKSVDTDEDYDSDDSIEDKCSLDVSERSNNSKYDHLQTTSSAKYYCSCISNMTKPVIICMSLIFMKRIALESIVGSTSVVTKNRYGWSIKNVGSLHLVNGFIVIPVSALSGYLSTKYEDRYMSLWFLAITLGGMAFLFDPTDLVNHDNETYNGDKMLSVGPYRYITGSLIAFSGIEACESYVASLMSKVVPSALAQGTFNSGLLATLVGTGGRATGDLFITVMGLMSVRNLLNLLILPGAALVGISICLILFNYDILGV